MNKIKIKESVKDEALPSYGRNYGSGNPIYELLLLIDKELESSPVRCDCDRFHRCFNHRLESHMTWKRENLKKKVLELFEEATN